ncbi:MAG: SdrD B-like domain-containing protein, partial [Candidatus Dojkabacteria bacterium]|nr:SdrD B-like domain-containing protein [Candidatus Dojkabacteria bacterium]
MGTLPVNLVFSEDVLPVTDSGVTVEDGVGDTSAGDEVGGESLPEAVRENEATEFEEVSMDFSEFKTGAVSVLGNNGNGNGDENSQKVTICHATGSHSHPYQENKPNKSGDVNGHDGHDGPIWYSGIGEAWGDIIPPFDYLDNSGDPHTYPGKNWTPAGQAILANDCVIPSSFGSVTITKDVVPDDASVWDFTLSGPGLYVYMYMDLRDGESYTFENLIPGSYNLVETSDPNYTPQITCNGISGSLGSNGLPLSVSDGQDVNCTITNTRVQASVCGDGILDNGEACDYGTLNDSSNCSATCTWVSACLPEMAANGSFETPVVETAQKWNAFPSELVPGWTAEWYGGSSDFNGHTRPAPMIELHSGVNGWTSADGLQHAELDSDWTGPIGDFSNEPASISLYQDIPVLGGYEYKVSWQYAPRPNHGNNHLQVMVDDVEALDTGVIAGGSTIAWSSHEYTFTADSDGVVRVRFTERGTPDSLGMLLDDVSVECLGQAYVCVDGPAWAYSVDVDSATQGTKYNGSAITDPERVDSDKALGATDGAFFSLGMGGSLILAFDHYVMNVADNDLSVNETTWNRLSDIEEKAKVYVSQDGSSWTYLGEASSFSDGDGNGTRDGETHFDLGGLPWIRYVKLEESSVGQIASDDGFDVDSVFAVHGVCEEPVICGDGKKAGDEECEGADGVTEGKNFCTPTCQLIPIYDGDHACSGETVPVRLDVSYLIDAKNPTGVSVPLLGGQEYLFEISGTYQFGHETRRSADAAYATEDSWSKIRGDIGIWGTAYRGVTSVLGELGRGVGVVEWDDDSIVNDDHTYRKAFTPNENMDATFLISDWYGDWYGNTCDGQGCMSDNSGSIELEVYECRPTADVTVCKEDTGGMSLPGWDMVLASKLVDGPTAIDVRSGEGTNSTDLPAGTYLLKVSGTYRYGSSLMNADAGFSYRPESIPSGCDCWLSGFELASDSNGLMAWVNGGDVDWGVYNRAHEYLYVYEHTEDGPINFSIWDNNYGDNVNNGDFQFEIFELVDRGTTGDNGCVRFDDVPYGDYYLDEMLQENWDRNSGTGVITVDEESETFRVVNKRHAGYLTVCKFNDLDKDGIKDEGERNIRWDISVKIADNGPDIGDGTWDTEDRCYHWTLPVGSYTVEEEVRGGWVQTFGENPTDVEITDGGSEEVLFGNHKISGSITGYKFNDHNGNGTRNWNKFNPMDELISGWNIRLYRDGTDGWELVKEKQTGTNGYYGFNHLVEGTYYICEVSQNGWRQTYPEVTDGDLTLRAAEAGAVMNESPAGNESEACWATSISFEQEDVRGLGFGNFRFGEIHGRKFEDYNGNGRWDTNGKEQEISGWEMHLYRETEDGWRKIREDVTNEEGRYSFRRLPLGQYYVCEVNQEGWTQTAPSVPQELGLIGILSEYPIANQSPDPDESPVCWAVSITAPQSPTERVNRG